ncbi:MAG: CidA/LrgA family protein [Enterococcus sp.]
MKVLSQFSIILLFSLLGEGVRMAFQLPIPGSILGILFLFSAFQLKVIRPATIKETSGFLLNNLTILFVPAGVSLMKYYDDIKTIWPILLGGAIVCGVVTLVSIGKTAEVVEKLTQKKTLATVQSSQVNKQEVVSSMMKEEANDC